MKRKRRSIAKEIIQGLEEFTKVLESGEKLEDHFRVTTIDRTNGNVISVKGPKSKRNKQ